MIFFKSKRTLIIVAVCVTLPVIGLSASYRISEKSSPTADKRISAVDPDEIFGGPSKGATGVQAGGSASLEEGGNGAPAGTGNNAGGTAAGGGIASGTSPGDSELSGSEAAGGGATGSSGAAGSTGPSGEITGTKPVSEMSNYELLAYHYQEIGTDDRLIRAMTARFKADAADGNPSALDVKLARELSGKVIAEQQKLSHEGRLIEAPHQANLDQLVKLCDLNEIRAFAIFQAYVLSQEGRDYSARLKQASDAKLEYDSLYTKAAPKP